LPQRQQQPFSQLVVLLCIRLWT